MKRAAGFTLVELLASLSVLALMAVLSWRGLDGMLSAQAGMDRRTGQAMALQAGLAQWTADLDALAQLPQAPAMDWNGRALRLTRRGTSQPADGIRVVAWTQRDGQWLRWQSAPLATRGEVDAAWQQAGVWAGNPGDAQRRLEVAVAPLQEWQIFYFRGDSWTNPLSSDAAGPDARPAASNAGPLPDGIRLVLVLPPGQALAGRISRDWASPRLAGGKT